MTKEVRYITIRIFDKFSTCSFLIMMLMFLNFSSVAQEKDYSKDVRTIGSIVNALYEVISGPADQIRDWDRFRNLFKIESRLIPTNKNKEGEFSLRAITPEEYIELFTNNIKLNFFEKELHHEIEEYGTIAHVFSTYETTDQINGKPTNRGINSIQLYKDADRYYVVTVFWCAESMGFPLPERYLN